MPDYLDRNISTVDILGENISLTILVFAPPDADIRSLNKAAALTVGDTENAKLGKVECTSSAWF